MRGGTYLAEFFALVVRQQRAQTLEAGVDALHAPPLVAVGNLASHALLVVRVQAADAAVTAAVAIATFAAAARFASAAVLFAAKPVENAWNA